MYRLNKNGSGFLVLHSFTRSNGDGGNPFAGLIAASDGAYYGTTQGGGSIGAGTIFRIAGSSPPIVTFSVVNTNDSGLGSLRQAILDANASFAASNIIVFNIPGPGPHVIAPTSALPALVRNTVLDGYSQPGAVSNTLAAGFNADLRIVLNGLNAGSGAVGVQLAGSNCVVRGLVIVRFTGGGLQLWGGGGHVLEGNSIGLDATGAAAPNSLAGVDVVSSSRNLIGGTVPGARNVISANGSAGIDCAGTGADSNQVVGNFIGVDFTATLPRVNVSAGIFVSGNFNRIGGVEPGAANTVAFNGSFLGGPGIRITSGVGNSARGNRLFANAGLGIDLGPSGVTPNDSGDVDSGPNRLQNFPMLISATNGGMSLVVTGTLHSASNATFQIDFYANAACDPSTNGEGQEYLGTLPVSTDPSGNAAFQAALPPPAPTLRFITATATDTNGNTSEFSACAVVPILNAWFVVVNTNDGGPGSLRQALLEAAASPAITNTVEFDIPGQGPHVIAPTSALPTLAQGTVMDGYTQPGAEPNTLADGFDAALQIALDGSAAGLGTAALRLTTNNTVRGLAIFGWRDGIEAQNGLNLLLEGNAIGLDAAGAVRSNLNYGIVFNGTARNNMVGGTNAAARNVISANGAAGIAFNGSFQVATNSILGNFIGTDFTGQLDRGNGLEGLSMPGLFNRIGSIEPGGGNRIAFNRRGVFVSGSGAMIRGNRIFSNDDLPGIDLSPAGVTLNDPGDTDGGGNGGQNYPVLNLATNTGAELIVRGTLNSSPNRAYELDFYANAAPDSSGYGGGELFLGSTGGMTDSSGNASFDVTFAIPDPEFRFISATATDPQDNTSEFSLCARITTASAPRTIVLTPVADTSLFSKAANNNLGANQSLPAGSVASLHPARAVMRFDVAGAVPAGSTITRVRLQLTVVRVTYNPSTEFALHRLNVSWGEGNKGGGTVLGIGGTATAGEATWRSRFHLQTLWTEPGGSAGTDFVATPSASEVLGAGSELIFGSTPSLVADVESWLANPTADFGWLLKEQIEGDEPSARRFGSREHPSSRPQLIIDYEPPPETFTVVNTNDSGPGSLRAALMAARDSSAPRRTIAFAIPGDGPHVITLLSALPPLLGQTMLDGFTQPGATPNTLVKATAAT